MAGRRAEGELENVRRRARRVRFFARHRRRRRHSCVAVTGGREGGARYVVCVCVCALCVCVRRSATSVYFRACVDGCVCASARDVTPPAVAVRWRRTSAVPATVTDANCYDGGRPEIVRAAVTRASNNQIIKQSISGRARGGRGGTQIIHM